MNDHTPQRAGSLVASLARAQWKRTKAGRCTAVIIATLIPCIILTITEPSFLTWANWQNIIISEAAVMFVGVGVTIVVLAGGLDLSFGSMNVAAAMTLGLLLEHHVNWILACLATLAAGVLMGLVNGILVGHWRIPHFGVTLGTLSIYQSIALLTTGGDTISLFGNNQFGPVGTMVTGTIGPIPVILVIGAGVYMAVSWALHYTSLGRAIFAVGSNAEAASLAGINAKRIHVLVYAACGLFASAAGIVLVGRLTAADPAGDPNMLMDGLAVVLIGGTAFSGGLGGLLGTAVGVLFLGVIENGLELMGVSTSWQGVVSGGILVAAIGFGVSRNYRFWRKARPASEKVNSSSEAEVTALAEAQ